MNESKVRKLKWIFVKLRVYNLHFCLLFFFFLGGGGLLIIYGSGQVPNPSTTKKPHPQIAYRVRKNLNPSGQGRSRYSLPATPLSYLVHNLDDVPHKVKLLCWRAYVLWVSFLHGPSCLKTVLYMCCVIVQQQME